MRIKCAIVELIIFTSSTASGPPSPRGRLPNLPVQTKIHLFILTETIFDKTQNFKNLQKGRVTHMAFDAGMTAAVCAELSETAVGSKIEKIYQPSADEIVLLCRGK